MRPFYFGLKRKELGEYKKQKEDQPSRKQTRKARAIAQAKLQAEAGLESLRSHPAHMQKPCNVMA